MSIILIDRPIEPDADAEEAWRVEIERRVAQVVRGEVDLVPGDEVFESVRRLPRKT